MAIKIQTQIVTGSSREDIRDSVGSKPHHRCIASFQIKVDERVRQVLYALDLIVSLNDEVTVSTVINGLDWEDGTGESFLLRGDIVGFYVKGTGYKRTTLFSAHYRTSTRKGILTFEGVAMPE